MRNPLLTLLLLPAMEIGLLALFAARYGLGAVAIEVFGTSVLGILLLRRSGTRSLLELQARVQQAQDSPETMIRDLLRAVSGLLLVIPGIATDLVGLALMLPAVRERLARNWAASGAVFRHPAGGSQRPPGPDWSEPPREPRRSRQGGDVIEGEFTRED